MGIRAFGVVFVMAGAVGCAHLQAANEDVTRTSLGLEQQRRAAQVSGDWQTIQYLNAPDMVDIGGNSAIRTTAQSAEAIRSGTLKFTSSEAQEEQVRVYGEVAVVTGVGHRTGAFGATAFDQHFRFTRIYVKQTGGWRAVLAQNTPIAENTR